MMLYRKSCRSATGLLLWIVSGTCVLLTGAACAKTMGSCDFCVSPCKLEDGGNGRPPIDGACVPELSGVTENPCTIYYGAVADAACDAAATDGDADSAEAETTKEIGLDAMSVGLFARPEAN